MTNQVKEQVSEEYSEERFIQNYLMFKDICVDSKIWKVSEIIKLYEVFVTSLK